MITSLYLSSVSLILSTSVIAFENTYRYTTACIQRVCPIVDVCIHFTYIRIEYRLSTDYSLCTRDTCPSAVRFAQIQKVKPIPCSPRLGCTDWQYTQRCFANANRTSAVTYSQRIHDRNPHSKNKKSYLVKFNIMARVHFGIFFSFFFALSIVVFVYIDCERRWTVTGYSKDNGSERKVDINCILVLVNVLNNRYGGFST